MLPPLKRSAKLMPQAEDGMRTLRAVLTDSEARFEVFNAGRQGGKTHFGLFPRDLLTTALMLSSRSLLRESIRFAAHTIGTELDPVTGEEPGRVLHEWNRVVRDGFESHYNAAETSQLFLIAASRLAQSSAEADLTLLRLIRPAIEAAGTYLIKHIRNDVFVEDPAYCGATRYFAYATYWKDSHLPGRKDIAYPVSYSLVQAQTACGLRSLAALSSVIELPWESSDLHVAAARLVTQLEDSLWDANLGIPLIARDRDVAVSGVSSDALHMLAYLVPGDVSQECLSGVRAAADRLSTPYGFRSYAPGQTDYAHDAYHLGSVWPYEQVMIASGARTFGLPAIVEGATRVLQALGPLGFPEILMWNGSRLSAGGCDLQLWTCAVPQGFINLLSEKPARRHGA